MKATAEDIDTLARTVYGEARGDTYDGRIAVAWVVLNRVAAKSWFGKTITKVCLKPKQFSCWNRGDPNFHKIMEANMGSKAFQKCQYAALTAVLGHVKDPTGGATHYHHHLIKPSWAEGHTSVGRIGAHEFYDDVR